MSNKPHTPDPAEPLPWEGQPYSVKRHGVTITNCDSEPIQTPGCVQAHGVLLVLRPADLTILQASENVSKLLGVPLNQMLGSPITAAVGLECADQLRKVLADKLIENNPTHVTTLPALGGGLPLDVTVHTIGGLVLVEFEATGQGNQLNADCYALVKTAVARFQVTDSILSLAEGVTEEVRALTGFDRVMVYKFHEDFSGEVFAESKQSDLSPWLGHRYPGEDIPKPARDVFSKTWVRPLPDVGGELAELVPLVNPDTGTAPDMTYCALRGPSVMYTEYLQNMGVKAALTMPIRKGTVLWGLIACHHYAGPRSLSYQEREACELLAQIASLLYPPVEEREQLSYRLKIEHIHQDLVAQATQEGGLAALIEGKSGLLDGLSAGGAALCQRDRWVRAGDTPTETELNALADWLTRRPEFASPTRPLYATDCLSRDYSRGEAFAGIASGLLAFPLSRSRRIMLLWFRPEKIRMVTWAGNPYDKPQTIGPHGPRLTPRRSFELWREKVHLRSVPWSPAELEAASRLRLQLLELAVNQAEQMADLNTELARSNEELDAFAYIVSHDLKEPLRGIYRYAHHLLDEAGPAEAGDEERQKKLDGLMRLTIRMDNLLDSLLHFSRVGRLALDLDDTDLNEVLAEAIEMVGSRVEKGQVEFIVPRPLPRFPCDGVRVREVFANLLSNALKYYESLPRRIEVGYIGADEDQPCPNQPDGTIGQTIFYVRDNGIGISPNHHKKVFKMFKRLHPRDSYGGGTGTGLTIVKKLVERHRGQVWIDSELGHGTTVFFSLSDDAIEPPR